VCFDFAYVVVTVTGNTHTQDFVIRHPGGGLLLLLATVVEVINALSLVVDVQAISRNINVYVVVSLHWLEMLLLLLLPIMPYAPCYS
jgi:hypothetical protein